MTNNVDVWAEIERDWSNVGRRTALARRLKDEVGAGNGGEVVSALERLIDFGLADHARDREASWDRLVSPLRSVLHLSRWSELPPAKHKAFFDRLWTVAGATPASRRALAFDPNVPEAILTHLASDEDGQTLQALAENNGLTAAIVAKLATNEKSFIRYRAARHPAASLTTLTTLAKDENGDVRAGVAGHPTSPPKLLATLAKDTHSQTLKALADNPNTPSATLASIAKTKTWSDDTKEWAFVALAKNPSTPANALAALVGTDEWRVLSELASNPNLPAPALASLISKLSTSDLNDARKRMIARGLANNPNTPSDVLLELSKHTDDDVRLAAIAQRKDLGPNELKKLAKSSDPIVRVGVAIHPSTPAAILLTLAGDPDERVRANIVIDERVRRPLANDRSERAFAARGKACRVTPDVLGMLADDKSQRVRRWLTENSFTPAEALTKLSKAKEKEVRVDVAFHPSTSIEVLMQLLADKEPDVRLAVLRAIRMRPSHQPPVEAIHALVRREEKRVLSSVKTGKGDPSTLARSMLTSSRVLGLLAATRKTAVMDLTQNSRLYLEDLIPLPKPKPQPKTKSGATSNEKMKRKKEPAEKWTPSGKPGPLTVGIPPKKGMVPRWKCSFKKQKSAEPIDRAGGLPSVWSSDEEWPTCTECLKPMTFVMQVIGKAGGGKVDLGSSAALQVFACNSDEGCCCDEPASGMNAAILRREPLGKGTMKLPDDFPCDLEDAYVMKLEPGYDDARLASDAWRDEDESAYEKAWDQANTEKIGGVGTYGNEPSVVKCKTCKKKLEFFGTFWGVFQPFGSGTAYLHICPERHMASYQAVN